MQQKVIFTFFMGGLVVIGLYHLIIYSFRRKDPSPLMLGVYCLLWAGETMLSEFDGWLVRLFIPNISASLKYRVPIIFYFLTIPVIVMFFQNLYGGRRSAFFVPVSLVVVVFFSLLASFAPIPFVERVVLLFHLFSLTSMVWGFALLVFAIKRSQEGARIIMAGFILLALCGINDILLDLSFIHSVYITYFGVFIFVAFQATALSQRLSSTFDAVERLSVDLRLPLKTLNRRCRRRRVISLTLTLF